MTGRTLVPLDEDSARIVCTWAPTAAEVLMFAGPALPHPLTADALLATRQQGWRTYAVLDDAAVLEDGAVVGTGSLRPMGGGIQRLGRVLVDPGRRGQGLGRATMELLLAQAFADPATTAVSLGVYAQNQTAITLYRRLGFVEAGKRTTTRFGDQEWTSLQLLLERGTTPSQPAPDGIGHPELS